MCYKKLHGLFHSGSERVLTCEQQQQLGWGELQQHPCDFTGKGLWSQTNMVAIMNNNTHICSKFFSIIISGPTSSYGLYPLLVILLIVSYRLHCMNTWI